MLTDKKLPWALLVAAATLVSGSAMGQGLGNSPYSRLGLGDYVGNLGGVRQLGMGGTGIAAPNTGNVNELNPALLYYTPRTTWEVGFNAQVKTVRNATASSRTGTGTLGYLALAVPLNRRWGAGIGLKPYSTVDYEANSTGPVNGDPTSVVYTQYRGTGGLSEAYLGTGIHVLRDLNLGGSVSYLFGTIDQTTGRAIATPTIAARQLVSVNESLRYSDFLFRAALQYRHKFGKDLNVNLGAVQTFQANLTANRTSTVDRQEATGAVTSSVALSDNSGTVTVPALSQAGITLDNSRNWTASVDVSRQQWSKFQTFSALETLPLSNTWRVGAGGEFTPDPGSVEHYFQRVTYRFGLSVAQMPYQPAGQSIYDRAVHWGFAFPLPTASALESTTVSLAFLYGVRGNTGYLYGNTGNSNVQENYLRVQVGATLSNRWFIKRRLQ